MKTRSFALFASVNLMIACSVAAQEPEMDEEKSDKPPIYARGSKAEVIVKEGRLKGRGGVIATLSTGTVVEVMYSVYPGGRAQLVPVKVRKDKQTLIGWIVTWELRPYVDELGEEPVYRKGDKAVIAGTSGVTLSARRPVAKELFSTGAVVEVTCLVYTNLALIPVSAERGGRTFTGFVPAKQLAPHRARPNAESSGSETNSLPSPPKRT